MSIFPNIIIINIKTKDDIERPNDILFIIINSLQLLLLKI